MEITENTTLKDLFDSLMQQDEKQQHKEGEISKTLLDTEEVTTTKISKNVNAAIKALKVVKHKATSNELLADIIDAYANNILDEEERRDFAFLYKHMTKGGA